MGDHDDKIYTRLDMGADKRVGLCAAADLRGGQTSRRGCLYLSTEGHARVIPPLSEGLGGQLPRACSLVLGIDAWSQRLQSGDTSVLGKIL